MLITSLLLVRSSTVQVVTERTCSWELAPTTRTMFLVNGMMMRKVTTVTLRLGSEVALATSLKLFGHQRLRSDAVFRVAQAEARLLSVNIPPQEMYKDTSGVMCPQNVEPTDLR